jgi:hypothetical protein
MALRTEDELFNAHDLAILVHSHLDVVGHRLEGSRMRAALSGDDAMLEITVLGSDGVQRTIRLPDHQAVEDAIARSGSIGMIDLELNDVFQDSRRSGTDVIAQSAEAMGLPTSAFGLDRLGPDTSRAEQIGDALAELSALRMFEGPPQEDERTISIRYERGQPLVSLVGRNTDGDMDRSILLDELRLPATTAPMKDVADALRAVATDGPGRTYDAMADDGGMIRIDAALKVDRRDHASRGQCEAALERLDEAVKGALNPLDERAVQAPRKDLVRPVSYAKGPRSAASGQNDLTAMFGLAAGGRGGR